MPKRSEILLAVTLSNRSNATIMNKISIIYAPMTWCIKNCILQWLFSFSWASYLIRNYSKYRKQYEHNNFIIEQDLKTYGIDFTIRNSSMDGSIYTDPVNDKRIRNAQQGLEAKEVLLSDRRSYMRICKQLAWSMIMRSLAFAIENCSVKKKRRALLTLDQ